MTGPDAGDSDAPDLFSSGAERTDDSLGTDTAGAAGGGGAPEEAEAAGADAEENPNAPLIESAFGADNRKKLIDAYFAEFGEPAPADAWKHVYRMLLWADPTTGLAHCYESDKSQPGKPWYLRSLAFHEWLSEQYGVEPSGLATAIDWLFQHATSDLSQWVLSRERVLETRAAEQRKLFPGQAYPVPGEDPELVKIVRAALGEHLKPDVPDDVWRTLVQQVRQYVGTENKRRNLIGEGFEDVLAQVIERTIPALRPASGLGAGAFRPVRVRALLIDMPGFARANPRVKAKRGSQESKIKPDEVDIAIPWNGARSRTLVTVKWSTRADRENQFSAENTRYEAARSDAVDFDYVLVTNEFDPARLNYACDLRHGRGKLFTHVVHISPDAIRAVYAADGRVPPRERASKKGRARKTAQPKAAAAEQRSKDRVLEHIDGGRLISLEAWLGELARAAA